MRPWGLWETWINLSIAHCKLKGQDMRDTNYHPMLPRSLLVCLQFSFLFWLRIEWVDLIMAHLNNCQEDVLLTPVGFALRYIIVNAYLWSVFISLEIKCKRSSVLNLTEWSDWSTLSSIILVTIHMKHLFSIYRQHSTQNTFLKALNINNTMSFKNFMF